jgi:hypothetical protein
MRTLLPVLVAIVAVVFPGFGSRSDPACQCEITVYKRKRSILPCIVGILQDSATQKLFNVGALIVNDVVVRANIEGRTYCEVAAKRKCKVVAKVYFYKPCSRTLRIHDGDSIVCVFHMRKSREVLY